ncbi:unnamed protein product (macronuclear) [Paramecium tetraurelia]|uniref:Kinesin motor domain-containing protein n=1 Tax=Paramecium tetraurelia TaxID=5888 RepID=A0CWP2_PARTE|nr:uncharacterized protein GSPATT00001412001 [Paramecium tetraurelia]CAK75209.1 unnamed protein product [Paramecium tetraurelia]|eukprot:XP_001442606.1 hypothetical protein (macronuclear) [Paramecium tetraurelia strain d4-2]
MDMQEQQLNVQVAVRIRPLNQKEIIAKEQSCLKSDRNSIILPQNGKSFSFDQVFNQDSSQDQIFQCCVTNLILRCFEGYNSTILAYGQTGSGKTYTMGTSSIDHDCGMIPRVVYFLFQEIEKRKQEQDINITCSYVELYNEQIIDLLNESIIQTNVQPTIREEKDHTISIQNLTTIPVTNAQYMIEILNRGGAHRTTSATLMNLNSSRSHAIFTIYFEINRESEEGSLKAKFHFVDLAGSERLKKTQAIGKQMEEGININQSLLVLGNVIKTLSDQKKSSHVPYRESKLTRILQDSLGGNSNTYMIACISPAASNYEETINTLKYASRAREIKNKPTQNRDPHAAQVMALKQSINYLSDQIKQYQQLLVENNINTDSVKINQIAITDLIYQNQQQSCTYHTDQINKLKSQNLSLDQKLSQIQKDFLLLQKDYSESEIECFKAKKQRDQVLKWFQDARKLLIQNNITSNFVEDTNLDSYYNEIFNLKKIVQEQEQKIQQLQQRNDTLIKEAHRDQKLLLLQYHKQNKLLNLGETNDEYEMDETEFLENDQKIEEQENHLIEMDKQQTEIKLQLQNEIKQDYHKQIANLELEKFNLQRQIITKQDSAQINVLKQKIQEYETKIQEMKQKETMSKQLNKKLEEQESQVTHLKNNIESMKKQKVDLLKKMKQENQKYMKEKDEQQKELIKTKKLKIQQDTILCKLRNENTKKDIQLKRKDDELLKQKNEKLVIKQHNRYNPNQSAVQYDTFEKQIDDLFNELIMGQQAEEQITQEYKKLEEIQEELQIIQNKICAIQIKIDQLEFDIAQSKNQLNQETQKQLEIELGDFQEKRENIKETIEFQVQKINEFRAVTQKSNEYYTTMMTNQYFKDLPNWCIRSFRYVIDNWVKDHILMSDYAQQIEDLSQANQLLMSSRPSQMRKSIRSSTPNDDLKRQLNEYKRKLQASQNTFRTTSLELDYYKNFYNEQINKQQKDKSIGLKAQLQHSNSNYIARNYYPKDVKNEQEPQTLSRNKSIGPISSSARVRSSCSMADYINCSQEFGGYELIKTFYGHDQPILSLCHKENLLFSGQYKQVKVWDIETSQSLSTIEQSSHCRAIHYWAERDSIAISHGSQITLYDPQTFTSQGLLKSTIEEVKAMTTINGLFVAVGKSTNSSALNIWDHRQNNILYEFEKGSDILSAYGSNENRELIYGTLKHYTKRIPFSKNKYGQIQQLSPPQLDKVTGVASFSNFIVSCSLSKRMLLWNQQTGLEMQTNDSIHKDLIMTLAVDKSLKLIYTGSKDGQIKAIKINEEGKFQLVNEMNASTQPVNVVNVIQSNNYVVSGGQDKLIKIWKPSKQLLQQQNLIGEFTIDDKV